MLDESMINSLMPNLIAGAIILILDMVITYLIFNKLITNRDRKRWEPFRQHLYNSLIRSYNELNYYFDNFSKELQIKTNALKKSGYKDENQFFELNNVLRNAYSWYYEKRNEVFNAIQTASPSISPEISKKFKIIFRYLENNLFLTAELGQKLSKINPEDFKKKNKESLEEFSSKFERELPSYNIKMIGGYGNYFQVIEDIISADNFIIQNGEVLSKDEIKLRKEIEEKFDRLKK